MAAGYGIILTNDQVYGKLQKIFELCQWHESLSKSRDGDSLVPELEDKLNEETDPEVRRIIYSFLMGEHARIEDASALRIVAKRVVEEFPEIPLSWITFSEVYTLEPADLRLSLWAIDFAIEAARRTDSFRRQSLQTKARILRQAKDFPALEKCLIEIMSEPQSAGIDIAKEDDFIAGLNEGEISPDVEQAYRKFVNSPVEG